MFLQFGVFCQTNDQNVPGGYTYGCVIDAIRTNRTSYAATTKPPTTTTTTTAAPTTTTTTTAAPTTTTTTTAAPTTTTTTTAAPTTTTTTTAATTTTTTTAAPGGPDIDWSFSDSTAGWTLGRSNGAFWQRLDTNFPDESPLNNFSLQVIPSDIYSSELNFKKIV